MFCWKLIKQDVFNIKKHTEFLHLIGKFYRLGLVNNIDMAILLKIFYLD